MINIVILLDGMFFVIMYEYDRHHRADQVSGENFKTSINEFKER